MRTFVVVDPLSFLPILKNYLSGVENVFIVSDDHKSTGQVSKNTDFDIIIKKDLGSRASYRELKLCGDDRIMLCLRSPDRLKKCFAAVSSVYSNVPIIFLTHENASECKIAQMDNMFIISVEDLVEEQMSLIWRKIANRKHREELKRISRSAEKVLILLQDDPDPDAIASALALRIILGRNKQTAPIAAFGAVTRSENLNMIRLLDIPVMKISPEDLSDYSIIAMVDVQPPFFKNINIKADIVIDHHVCVESYDAVFTDIRTSYGAASTILGQYLVDGNYKITQRLATAIIYGIKTDTMFLDRDISPADIEIFTSMYAGVNMNLLRKIEHATLEYKEINGFVKALRNIEIKENVLFSFMGRVEREDIIPRLADFCLQIGESEWVLVCGVFAGQYVCSIRNVGYVKHAGEVARKAFGDVGSAGGHRSMAKAVMEVKVFKRCFMVSCRDDVREKIINLFLSAME